MQFTVSKRDFAKDIGQVLKGIPSKKDQPILKNFFIEAKGNQVFVTSNNQTVSVQSKTVADVEEEGFVCVDAKLLDGLLKKIKLKAKEDVPLIFSLEEDELSIDVNGSVTKLKNANTEEYPRIQWNEGETTFEIDGDSFMTSIKQISFSTSKNESRPVLSGVLFQVEKAYLTMVTTDGHRMSMKINTVENIKGETKKVIPVDSLVIVERILSSNKKSTMNVFISEKEAIFEVNGVRILTTFIPEDFINYKKIFGMPTNTHVMVEKESLLAVLERASIFIPKDKVALATLQANDDLLEVRISSESGNIVETLEANMTGDAIQIVFNVSYLILALRAIPEDRVAFHFINSMNPMILEGVGNKSYKHMLLPVKSPV